MNKMPAKEIEKRLGLQYAQLLKESPQTAAIYKDCQEVIHTSLSIMEHYNKISMAIKTRVPARRSANAFAQ
ncbi:MAG: hypothetical protein K0Q50_1530 [Vampirovibrio sp.]|jgi:hypothetical protein|nr:hypothetical protein [Vampirovibrio sp.]